MLLTPDMETRRNRTWLIYFLQLAMKQMKMRLRIQQMKVKNLPSHITMKTTAQKQDSLLKTYGFPSHQHLQAWEGMVQNSEHFHRSCLAGPHPFQQDHR